MAKRPVPGRVKTRLVPPYDAGQAAAVHAAMLRCVLGRVGRLVPGRKLLALDDDADVSNDAPLAGIDAAGWEVVPQGGGVLGERMRRVWADAGGGSAAFFGVDSPDAPAAALRSLWDALAAADAAAGPTDDGGYWTLVGRSLDACGPLLERIDWGTPAVYDQTRYAAMSAGLRFVALPRFFDVDNAADLEALRRRLAHAADPTHGPEAEPELATLAAALPPRPPEAAAPTREPAPTAMPDPAAPTPSAAVSPAPDAELAGLADATVLIVDDNEQNVELLQAYLEALPCRVEVAYDGRQALDRIEDPGRPKPDLILLDVMMPKISGFEVCRKLKDDPATRAIPVMMVTALNELGDIERGVESGTDDFVTKPVNKLELVTRCKSLLRVRQLKRDLERTEAHLRDIESRRGEA